MNVLERAISLIAPRQCVGCDEEGRGLCPACQAVGLACLPSRCYRCHQVSSQFQVCPDCRRSVALKHVWLAREYSGPAKELIHQLKFGRAKAVAQDIAAVLDDLLPLLPAGTVVTHAPTANKRVRIRGYDQAALIAKAFAAKRNLKYRDTLSRVTSSRQVGSSRQDRFTHLKDAFEVPRVDRVASQPILLIDDVVTSGATIESAAAALAKAGAKSVDAAAFAH